MNRAYKAIIFDMDGLMLDTERLGLESWKVASEKYGYQIEKALMLKAIGKNTQDTKKLFLEAMGPHFPFDKIRNGRIEYVRDYISGNGVPIKNGLLTLLKYGKDHKYTLAVATSTIKKHAVELLREAGIIHYFDEFVFGDEVEYGKPAPDIFLEASNRLKVEAKECIVLEDSENGIKAASLAGMTAVHIPDLIKDTEIIQKHASYTCNGLADVIKLLIDKDYEEKIG